MNSLTSCSNSGTRVSTTAKSLKITLSSANCFSIVKIFMVLQTVKNFSIFVNSIITLVKRRVTEVTRPKRLFSLALFGFALFGFVLFPLHTLSLFGLFGLSLSNLFMVVLHTQFDFVHGFDFRKELPRCVRPDMIDDFTND